MLTPGDVDLLALDAVFARMLTLGNRLGRRPQRADIRARIALATFSIASIAWPAL